MPRTLILASPVPSTRRTTEAMPVSGVSFNSSLGTNRASTFFAESFP